MRRALKYIIIAPFALVFLIFAFANRHFVTVAFDPFDSGDIPAFSISAPLFAVLIGSVMFGVLVGGLATWATQGKYRKAARQSRAELERLRLQLPPAPAPSSGASDAAFRLPRSG